MIVPPVSAEEAARVEIVRGPNIKPCPKAKPVPESLSAEVLLKVQDNITTDHIMPAGAKILPLRSNIPEIAKHVFEAMDPRFAERALKAGSGIVVGGDNYGQGSSREHAALAPMYLGVRAVFAKSFARIHKANLVNFGILPLVFENAKDYDALEQGDRLEMPALARELAAGNRITVNNATKGKTFVVCHDFEKRAVELLIAGGLLNYTKKQAENKS